MFYSLKEVREWRRQKIRIVWRPFVQPLTFSCPATRYDGNAGSCRLKIRETPLSQRRIAVPSI
jgi:hypothetical protein